MTIFTSTLARQLHATLDERITDEDYKMSDSIAPRWCDEMPMKYGFVDIQEYGGPGFAAEKGEGQEIDSGTIYEGSSQRVFARVFALKMSITEEAIEDLYYPEIVNAKGRLRQALSKTWDQDTSFMLVRGFNTAFTFFAGQPLWSASQALPGGGTFSNIAPVAFAPGRPALDALWVQARQLPGHDGIVSAMGYKLEKLLCPVEQEPEWRATIGSTNDPGVGEFNRINTANKKWGLMDIEVIGNPFWNNTATNYAVLTNCEGFRIYWKRKPKDRAWVSNENEVMCYALSARWARTNIDPRSTIGVNA